MSKRKITLFKISKYSKVIFVLAGVAIFLVGFLASYLMLGPRLPWAANVWKKAAAVFPLPVASIQGKNVSLSALQTAENLGATNPIDFVVRRTAVKLLAQQKGLNVTDEEIKRREQLMLDNWAITKESLISILNKRGVEYDDFMNLFVAADIWEEKLATTLNAQNSKVQTVVSELNSGTDFSSLATRYSDDLFSAPLGGDMGFVGENEIGSTVWQEALKLNEDEWAGPINTAKGAIFVKKIEEYPATETHPLRLHLQFILIKDPSFEQWLDEQIQQMNVKIFI